MSVHIPPNKIPSSYHKIKRYSQATDGVLQTVYNSQVSPVDPSFGSSSTHPVIREDPLSADYTAHDPAISLSENSQQHMNRRFSLSATSNDGAGRTSSRHPILRSAQGCWRRFRNVVNFFTFQSKAFFLAIILVFVLWIIISTFVTALSYFLLILPLAVPLCTLWWTKYRRQYSLNSLISDYTKGFFKYGLISFLIESVILTLTLLIFMREIFSGPSDGTAEFSTPDEKVPIFFSFSASLGKSIALFAVWSAIFAIVDEGIKYKMTLDMKQQASEQQRTVQFESALQSQQQSQRANNYERRLSLTRTAHDVISRSSPFKNSPTTTTIEDFIEESGPTTPISEDNSLQEHIRESRRYHALHTDDEKYDHGDMNNDDEFKSDHIHISIDKATEHDDPLTTPRHHISTLDSLRLKAGQMENDNTPKFNRQLASSDTLHGPRAYDQQTSDPLWSNSKQNAITLPTEIERNRARALSRVSQDIAQSGMSTPYSKGEVGDENEINYIQTPTNTSSQSATPPIRPSGLARRGSLTTAEALDLEESTIRAKRFLSFVSSLSGFTTSNAIFRTMAVSLLLSVHFNQFQTARLVAVLSLVQLVFVYLVEMLCGYITAVKITLRDEYNSTYYAQFSPFLCIYVSVIVKFVYFFHMFCCLGQLYTKNVVLTISVLLLVPFLLCLCILIVHALYVEKLLPLSYLMTHHSLLYYNRLTEDDGIQDGSDNAILFNSGNPQNQAERRFSRSLRYGIGQGEPIQSHSLSPDDGPGASTHNRYRHDPPLNSSDQSASEMKPQSHFNDIELTPMKEGQQLDSFYRRHGETFNEWSKDNSDEYHPFILDEDQDEKTGSVGYNNTRSQNKQQQYYRPIVQDQHHHSNISHSGRANITADLDHDIYQDDDHGVRSSQQIYNTKKDHSPTRSKFYNDIHTNHPFSYRPVDEEQKSGYNPMVLDNLPLPKEQQHHPPDRIDPADVELETEDLDKFIIGDNVDIEPTPSGTVPRGMAIQTSQPRDRTESLNTKGRNLPETSEELKSDKRNHTLIASHDVHTGGSPNPSSQHQHQRRRKRRQP